jgi:hypothetical protein
LKGEVLRSDTFSVTRLVRSLEEDWGGERVKKNSQLLSTPPPKKKK